MQFRLHWKLIALQSNCITSAGKYTPHSGHHRCWSKMCNQNHSLYNCNEFRKLSMEQRIEKAKSYHVCLNCRHPGHTDSNCKLTHCRYCNIKHNTLLHIELESPIRTTHNIAHNWKTCNFAFHSACEGGGCQRQLPYCTSHARQWKHLELRVSRVCSQT